MDTIVLKFGGSSVADNIGLNTVAEKIISFKNSNKDNKIVVVVSAQGKTTDNLTKQAKELSAIPTAREMDVLLSSGEQISIAKLAILLNRLGHKTISLTGWQAGIYTDSISQNAKIKSINPERIIKLLDDKFIVIVAGFQGINEENDITTLGRGGSDTTAVSLAISLNAKHCYIFSDVDGIYTADPRKVKKAKKVEFVSYDEMSEIASEGAKVLHDRCVELGRKYSLPIIAASTFSSNTGSLISNNMEEMPVKSIVKEDLVLFKIDGYNSIFDIYKELLANGLEIKYIDVKEKSKITFVVKEDGVNKIEEILEKTFKISNFSISQVSKIAIIGYGIKSNADLLNSIMNSIIPIEKNILNMQLSSSKLSILFDEKISDEWINVLHDNLIK